MIGSSILTIALVLSIFSLIMYFLTYRGATNTLNYARLAYHGMTMLVILASTYLLYIILTHQYQYHYVFSFSSRELPVGLLMSTFWAGQEGSFLLWLLMTSVIGIILQSYTAKREGLEPAVMFVYTMSTSFLLMMVSPLMKNPFAYIWVEGAMVDSSLLSKELLGLPFLQNYIVQNNGATLLQFNADVMAGLKSAGISLNQFLLDGKGLNPLLQNFWMQIHPPILFGGFAMATVPFSFAVAALIKNEYKDWVRQSLPWTLAGAGILGLGIMLGGYWAYGVLGWGGYWAWDPVENSSLVPWLVSVAAIHTMLVQRRTQTKSGGVGRYSKTNLILAILVYVCVVYSTFLTRSGILGDASVHSFAEPGRLVYMFLIVFFGFYTLLGAGMVIYRWKYLATIEVVDESALSRELALFTATVAIGASALIVLVGTSAPLIGKSVDTSFYNEMHIPLTIIIGLLNGLSLILKWNTTKREEIFKKILFSFSASVVLTLGIVFIGGVYKIMMILLAFSAAFTLFVNAEMAYSIIRGNFKMLGGYVSHIGFAILILGIIGSSGYSQEKQVNLTKGKKLSVYGYTLEYVGVTPFDNGKKYKLDIKVTDNGKVKTLSPVMFQNAAMGSWMKEPDILVSLTKDLYIAPLGIEQGGEEEKVPIELGKTTEYKGVLIKYLEYIKPADMAAMQGTADVKIGAKLELTKDGKSKIIEAVFLREKGQEGYPESSLTDMGISVKLGDVSPATKKADILITQLNQPKEEVFVVQASIKPFVNFVWTGVLISVLGFAVSVMRRLTDAKKIE